ncbi:hypothetical protein D3C73_1319780 [compost metagenome]
MTRRRGANPLSEVRRAIEGGFRIASDADAEQLAVSAVGQGRANHAAPSPDRVGGHGIAQPSHFGCLCQNRRRRDPPFFGNLRIQSMNELTDRFIGQRREERPPHRRMQRQGTAFRNHGGDKSGRRQHMHIAHGQSYEHA